MEKRVSHETILNRQKAEEQLKKEQSEKAAELPSSSELCKNVAEHLKIIHELEVHQRELEMQNVELKLAVDKAATATALYDFSPSGYFTLESDGTISEANLNGARMLGKERLTLVNRNFIEFVSPETLTVFKDFLKKAGETNSKQICEVKLVINGNSTITVYLEGFVPINEKKCLVTAIDLTENRKDEEAIRLSESRLGRAELASKTGNWELHIDSQMICASEGAIKLYGLDKDQFDFADIKKVTLHEYRPFLDLALKNLIEENKPYDVEFKIKTQDTGEIKDIHSIALYDKEKRILFGSIQDITERKQAEADLLESKEYYQSIFKSMIEGFCIIEMIFDENMKPLDYRFLETNAAFEDQSGLKDVEGKLARDVAPGLEEHWFEQYGKIALTGEAMHFENEAKPLDDRWLEIHAFRIGGPGSLKVAVCFNDATERKQAEKALFESTEQFRLLFENSTDAILFTKPDGAIYLVNPEAERMLGRSEEELLSVERSDIADMNDPRLEPAIEKRLKTGRFSGELNLLKKDGTPFPVELTSTIFKDSNGIERSSMIIHDITERKQAEQSLLQSEERYRTLFNSMIIGFCEVEVYFDENMKAVDYRYLETNAAFEEQTGLIDVRGKLTRDILPDQEEYWFELYGKVALTGELMRFEREAAGLNRWFDVCAFRMGGQDSRRVAVCFSDISERKLAEVALQKSEKSLSDIYASMSEGISVNEIIYDTQGKAVDYVLVDANPAFEKITGQKLSEVKGMKGSDRYSMEKAPYFDLWAQVASTGQPISFETFFPALNKHFSISAFSPEKGKFATLFRDITEIKKAEKDLFESTEQFRLLFENSSDAILFANSDGTIYSVNAEGERMLGRTKEEIINLGRNAVSDINDPRLKPALEERRKTGRFKGELNYLRKDGTSFPVDVTTTIFKDSNGIERSGIIARDITERKQAEQSLLESKEYYQNIFKSMIEAFCVIEMIFDENMKPVDFRFLETNAAFEEHSGLKDVEGKLIRDLVPGIEENWFEVYGNVALTGQSVRYEDESKPFNRWFDVNVFRIGGPGSRKLTVCFNDTTKRKQDEKALFESTEQFRLLFENSTDAILYTNPDGAIYLVNPEAERMFGRSKEEIVNLTRSEINDMNDPRLIPALEERRKTGRFSGELNLLRKDGTIFPAELTSTIFKDSRGIEKSSMIIHDITERKRAEAELIAAKEKAEESDRLKSAFLANMSHELRTPLNSIIGFSELMSDLDFHTNQESQFAQIINTSGNNLLSIINDIMDISKIEAGHVQVINQLFSVNKLMIDLQEEYSFKAIEKGIELILDPLNPIKEVFIESDQTKIRQILVNLVGNSIKFTEKGFVKIGLRITEGFVQFHVKDTGIGIPAEFQTQIFERFRQVESSDSRKYGGTGLGLAISKSLTELLGGTLWMESKKGKGSTFYFIIPINH